MKNIIKTTLLAGLAVSVLGTAAHAATATSTFTAKIVIENDCSVSSPNDLDFGTVGLLSSNKDTSMDFTVTCTNGARKRFIPHHSPVCNAFVPIMAISRSP